MKTIAVLGVPNVDIQLASVPDVVSMIGPYDQRLGYKSWSVPRDGRRTNWFQWNDGDVPLRISFPNRAGLRKVWKAFIRSDVRPASGLWDKPQRYERASAQWMPAGTDVWGLAYEDLADMGSANDVIEALLADLKASSEYALRRYRD